MSLLQSIQRKFSAFCATGAGLSMGLMFAIIVINSVRRYIFGKSFVFGEELPIYLAVYGFMFGVSMAYIQDKHIRFDVIYAIFPARIKKWLHVIVHFIMIIVGASLAYSGWLNALKRGDIEASSLIGSSRIFANFIGFPSLEIFGYMSAWLFAIAFGGVILCFAATLKFIESWLLLKVDG